MCDGESVNIIVTQYLIIINYIDNQEFFFSFKNFIINYSPNYILSK
jgi:hypothetical protein